MNINQAARVVCLLYLQTSYLHSNHDQSTNIKMDEQSTARQSGRVTLTAQNLADVIVRKFANYPQISYADVAARAAKLGLVELATLVRIIYKLFQINTTHSQLLDKEPQVRRQVKMLLQLERWPQALVKATESHDPDLCTLCVSQQQPPIQYTS
jgi:hypothetical protein